MPKSQVGASNPVIRLHYVDGQYAVPPEVVEASLGPHMQVMREVANLGIIPVTRFSNSLSSLLALPHYSLENERFRQ